jgi:hypothetical protein
VGCYGSDKTNCPEAHGPDHDFGQSPILKRIPFILKHRSYGVAGGQEVS